MVSPRKGVNDLSGWFEPSEDVFDACYFVYNYYAAMICKEDKAKGKSRRTLINGSHVMISPVPLPPSARREPWTPHLRSPQRPPRRLSCSAEKCQPSTLQGPEETGAQMKSTAACYYTRPWQFKYTAQVIILKGPYLRILHDTLDAVKVGELVDRLIWIL